MHVRDKNKVLWKYEVKTTLFTIYHLETILIHKIETFYSDFVSAIQKYITNIFGSAGT